MCFKQDVVSPLVADPPDTNSTADTDPHILWDIVTPCQPHQTGCKDKDQEGTDTNLVSDIVDNMSPSSIWLCRLI